jgi:hypothetical protein
MSAMLKLAAFAVLVASATAIVCPAVTSSNPYSRSSCAGYVACERAMCVCSGVANGQDETCLKNVSKTAACSTLVPCVQNFMMCLDTLTDARNNSTDPCNSWAVTLHSNLLATVAASYNGSAMQAWCAARACQVQNATGVDCNLGVNASLVCKARTTVVRLIVATLQLGGSAYEVLLLTESGRAQLRSAIIDDVARLFGVDPQFIEILSIRLGSLIVEFAVLGGANATAAALLNTIATAGSSTSWLTSVKNVYKTVSNETITVQGFAGAVATTAGPGGVTPPPPPPGTTFPPSGPTTTTSSGSGSTTTTAPSINGASSVSTFVVAVAAVLAVMVL